MIPILTFQKRLLAGVLLLLAVTTVTLGFIASEVSGRFLRARFEDRMSFLARYLALNAELGMLLSDREMLSKLAANLLSEKDLLSVTIENEKGDFLVKEGDDSANNPKREAVSDVLLRQQEEEALFLGVAPGNKYLGKVKLVYSTRGIEDYLIRLRYYYAFAALILGILGIVAFMFFSRSLVAPLKDLVQSSREVARGNFSIKAKGGSLPETRELAETFNQMLEALEKSRNDLKKTYQEMMNQKALAQVGQFAFSVAHEVKNPLGIIKGALDIIRKPDVDKATKETMMNYAEEEIQRVDGLVHDFLAFSRPQKPRFEPVDLNAILLDAAKKMAIEWKDRIVFTMEIPLDKQPFKGDPSLLYQAFLNILKNACEACRRDGQVYVKAGLINRKWIAEIRDNGQGMDKEVARKAFDPFFTTKAKGTGLGLSFVERVVKAHGGSVAFKENSPKGTIFELSFQGQME